MQNVKIKFADDLFLSIAQHDTKEIETAFVSGGDLSVFKTLDVFPDNDDDVMRYQKPIDVANAIMRGLDYVKQEKAKGAITEKDMTK